MLYVVCGLGLAVVAVVLMVVNMLIRPLPPKPKGRK